MFMVHKPNYLNFNEVKYFLELSDHRKHQALLPYPAVLRVKIHMNTRAYNISCRRS